MTGKQYWSARMDKNPKATELEYDDLLRGFYYIYESFVESGYFDEKMGLRGTMSSESSNHTVKRQMFYSLRKADLWPISDRCRYYLEDDLFDVIEFLFDYISRPSESFDRYSRHTFYYDAETGQEEYRSLLNSLLQDYPPGYRLSERGEIEVLGPTGLDDLLDESLPPNATDDDRQRVGRSVELYRSRKSTIHDKRDAVKNLADVLENLRKPAKEVLRSEDENDLFNILNNFDIRHHNDRQKTDYDPKFLDWIFYHSLAAIHTILALLDERT